MMKYKQLIRVCLIVTSLIVTAPAIFANPGNNLKFNNYTYIFLGPGLSPDKDRMEIKTDKMTFTAVGIDIKHKEQVIAVSKEAVANGAQLIELCGGFGPLWIAKVHEALGGKVPVGSVAYGPEARAPLLDLLSPVTNSEGLSS